MSSTTSVSRRPPLPPGPAAEYLGITERHLRELVYRREVPYTRVGRLLRFMPHDLDAYLEARTVQVVS
jgi:excisionase family DNA binding protein